MRRIDAEAARLSLKTQDSHPIDRHVGARVRQRRVELLLSQTALGARLGVTFQAVQKYEGGTVRMSASRLYDVALALHITPAFFFEGYDGGAVPETAASALGRRDVASLVSGYARIRDPRLQADLRRLIATLGEPANS
jgi:transcriptional regulator with XRE-family HTH domain